MMQQMHQFTKTWFAVIGTALLATSFIAWGINDVFRASTPDTVASVGGTDIPMQTFQQEYQLRTRELSRQRQQPITPDEARAMGLGKAVLDDVTADAALSNLASDMGISASTQAVNSEILGERAFAGPLGQFDQTTYLRDISQLGFTDESFRNYMRGAIVRQQLTAPVQAGFEAPPSYVSALIAWDTEERAVDYFVITPASLPPVADPGDAVLSKYMTVHPNQFSTPEYRDASFAYIAPSDVMNEVSVSPEQIKQQYEANASKYNVPEERDLEQLSFTNQKDATAARASIDSGMNFAQLARSLGKKPADISIGTLTQKDLTDARGPAAFALKDDGVTPPVQTAFGWFLLHVTKITPGKSTTLDQATPEIRQSLLQQTAAAKVADMMNAAQDSLGTGAEIQEVAQKSGMHYEHVAAMDRNGLDMDGKSIPGPSDDDQFRSEVFRAEVGEYGDPEQSKSGLAFVIKVNGVTPPKLKPLQSVRSEVLAAWSADRQGSLLRAKADALAQKASDGPSFQVAAKEAGASVLQSPALSRGTADKTFSKGLTEAIFDAAPGAATLGPLGQGEGYVVARVTGIRHGELPPQSPLFQRVEVGVSQQIGQDVAQTLASATKAKQGVAIHQDVVDRVIGGGGNS
jgi:peptidyl-prolyl cis-trans isomerase D